MNYPITYAPNREDLIIAGILKSVKNGFYVDLGSEDPDYQSMTKRLYRSGWHGINITSEQHYLTKLKLKRPRDTNIMAKIGLTRAVSSEIILGLEAVLELYQVNHIDVLRIDAVSYKNDAVSSNNWSKYRPTLVLLDSGDNSVKQESEFLEYGYVRIFFDGLNEYFIVKDSQHLAEHFSYSEFILSQEYVTPREYETMLDQKEEVHHLNRDRTSLHHHVAALNDRILDLQNKIALEHRRVEELEYYAWQSRRLKKSLEIFIRAIDVTMRANILRLQNSLDFESKSKQINIDNRPDRWLKSLPSNKKKLFRIIRLYDFEINLNNNFLDKTNEGLKHRRFTIDSTYLLITRKFTHAFIRLTHVLGRPKS